MDRNPTARRPALPIMFDDIRAGDKFALGSYSLTREEVMDFARRFDPQPYHLDDAAARANPIFGRLSASGWHNTVIISALGNDFIKSARLKSICGAGASNVRWYKPSYPGDVLTGDSEVLVARPSRSDPSRRILTMHMTLSNQDGVLIASADVTGIFSPDAVPELGD